MNTDNLKISLKVLVVVTLTLFRIAVNTATATTYYVSTTGDDTNSGTSQTFPFKTIGKVNALTLNPGDKVLFKCGDVWRAETLRIIWSGTASAPITFGSYPAGCTNKPIFLGTQAIADWTLSSGNIYVADLSAETNSGKFPSGINQLFRDGQRLLLGRWPNLDVSDDANFNGGYSTIDSLPTTTQITDSALPPQDWTGAIAHIKSQRWRILNREVVGTGSTTLTLNETISCRDGCAGWGYFLNNHLGTLDQDGEWYYDATNKKVYVYSVSGPPANMEGSVILEDSSPLTHGSIMLGHVSLLPIAYVIIENFEIKNWFNHGIGTPLSLKGDVYHHITIQNTTIRDVNATGINLSTGIWDATNGRNGYRGGRNMTLLNNVIEGANHFGIMGYLAESTIQDNSVKNIGLIENLGKSGMGCEISGTESCNEDGTGIEIRRHLVEDSGHSNTVQYNRIEKSAYTGIDILGPNNVVQYNAIEQACYAKGDCGGIRTFYQVSTDLTSTKVYNVTLKNNIILDSVGNVDGVIATYRQQFGVGLYIDGYSRDVTLSNNTIINATNAGILFRKSTGRIEYNTVYNAASEGSLYAGLIQVDDLGLTASISRVTSASNRLYGLNEKAWTFFVEKMSNLLASNNNYFFHPSVDKNIALTNWDGRRTLTEWQAYSGMDGNSKKNWFTLNAGDSPRSVILYNDTKSPKSFDLGVGHYQDLNQKAANGIVTLQPFTSIILVKLHDNIIEVHLKQGSTPLPKASKYNFGMVNVGSGLTKTFTIENTAGTADLILSGSPRVAISGTHAADFTVTRQPASPVAPGESVTFDLRFAPGATGIRTAIVSIANNDSDENPYTLTLYGGGPQGRLLWARPAAEGSAVVWALDDAGNFLGGQNYTVGSGWYANEVAYPGTNGYLLWTRPAAEGRAVIWTIDASGSFLSGQLYTAGPGYYATGVTYTGTNGYLLWARPAAEGRAVLWTLNTKGNFVSGKLYTAGPGYYATDFAHNGSNGYLLWARPAAEGKAVLWTLDAGGNFVNGKLYTAGPGYYATGFAHSGTNGYLLWTRPSSEGKSVVWTLTDSGNFLNGKLYTVGSGWYATGYDQMANVVKSSRIKADENAVAYIMVRKAGNGNGTIIAGDQICGAGCQELILPYNDMQSVILQILPDESSVFGYWQDEKGILYTDIYYAQPGDIVYAVFEKK
ncbi:glycosyl hydrolase family 98 putative carbohydrate binding module [Candidatus Vecturithrix granuli]|uniref:Glycosyl hydrolase family 98 putative carbohydrate binding module n=1 Tax=Vecturithrix granuli TaxID=1499967 RepID=A0A081BW72_VECG1|nr:glycosyl hydrolase family 98 putative carbohydrate binding module [Candidatus Vecturithrix granuli]